MSADDYLTGAQAEETSNVDHYGASYSHFVTTLYQEIRAETFGEDIGQNSWLTADEHDNFISWLNLTRQSRLLDVACGSGGPTLRIARKTGCQVYGIDIHEQGIETARSSAQQQGFSKQAQFEQVDATEPLPFGSETFDAILCIDAINHLPNRQRVLTDWARILKPGGRLVFIDPIIITGPLSHEEIAIRSSIGFFLFMPPGGNEPLIEAAGLKLLDSEDRTENMAIMAQRWHTARETRTEALQQVEGVESFDGQQRFFKVAAHIAQERRLSRFAFFAAKPR